MVYEMTDYFTPKNTSSSQAHYFEPKNTSTSHKHEMIDVEIMQETERKNNNYTFHCEENLSNVSNAQVDSQQFNLNTTINLYI